MSPSEHTNVLETQWDSVAGVLSKAEIMSGNRLDEFPGGSDEPIDLTVEDTATNAGAILQDDELIDEALRHASSILNQGQDQADRLVEDAQARAVTIVGEADETAAVTVDEAKATAAAIVAEANEIAAEVLEAAVAEATRIDEAAYQAADEAAEQAAALTDDAIAEATMLIADAEERAEEICQRSRAKAERLISAAATPIEDKHVDATETLAALTALTALADSRLVEAEKNAASIVKQARMKAAEIADRSEREALELRETSKAVADQVVADAQIEADEIMVTIEELKTTAHARLATAVAEATDRGAAIARRQIDTQLIDTRREIDELETKIVRMRAELAEGEKQGEVEAPALIAPAIMPPFGPLVEKYFGQAA